MKFLGRNLLFFALALVCLDSKAQTSLFTAATNGTFEAVGSELVVQNYSCSGKTNYGTIARSSEFAFEGNYSLKFSVTSGLADLALPLTDLGSCANLVEERYYIFRLRVYIPSTGNNTVDRATIHAYRWDGQSAWLPNYCRGEFNTPTTLFMDRWIDLEWGFSPKKGEGGNHILAFTPLGDGYKQVYIDKIELIEYPAIEDNEIIEGNSITINPSGGIPWTGEVPANDNWYPFRNQWSDGIVWSDVRTNLPGGEISVSIWQFGTNQCNLRTFTYSVEAPPVIPLCSTLVPRNSSGDLKFDKLSGQLVFKPASDCLDDIPIGCIGGQLDVPLLNNVVSASAATFSDNWSYDANMFKDIGGPLSELPYENGQKGKWRQEASYVFNTSQVKRDKNYNSGTYRLAPFNWQHAGVNERSGWLLANKIEKYTPNGDPVQERNALNIASAAKFGYYDAVPYLVAQNANYNSVLFESFENNYTSSSSSPVLEDGFEISGASVMHDASTAHAGLASLRINGNTIVPLRTFRISHQIKDHGILVKMWVKGNTLSSVLTSRIVYEGNSQEANFIRVARTGEWTLFQATLAPGLFGSIPYDDELTEDEQAGFILQLSHGSSETLWIDDVRVQPYDAEMTAYVYDRNSLRLLAVLDDQHFGLYYQYNQEGKLIRKMIETKEGIKTIQETQYNSYKVNEAELAGN